MFKKVIKELWKIQDLKKLGVAELGGNAAVKVKQALLLSRVCQY